MVGTEVAPITYIMAATVTAVRDMAWVMVMDTSMTTAKLLHIKTITGTTCK